MPTWTTLLRIARDFGLWAMVALGLIVWVVMQQNSDAQRLQARIEHLQSGVDVIANKMDAASTTMTTFANRRETRDEAVVALLLRLCIQTANDGVERNACYVASATAAIRDR